jgi:hypothetical protein
MPLYFATAQGLASPEELAQNGAGAPGARSGRDLERQGAAGDEPGGPSELRSSLASDEGEVIAFEEIGIGKPLTIEIRRVYTGEHPKAGPVAYPRHDLLVTSAIRDIATFGKAARAINFVRQEVGWKSTITNPAAIEEGTPLVYYTPAVVGENQVLTLEMGFQEYKKDYLEALSGAFAAAGNLPVFTAASGHLLAAGTVTKIVSSVLDRILNLGPVFSGTFEIPWSRAGKRLRKANLAVVFDHRSGEGLTEDYRLNDAGELVHQTTGQPYDGLEPYMVISLDGRKNAAYEQFTPTAASAALLDQFFGENDDPEGAIQPLVEALTLYNDWMFRDQARALAKELKATPDGAEKEALQEKYAAVIANIQHDELKPT